MRQNRFKLGFFLFLFIGLISGCATVPPPITPSAQDVLLKDLCSQKNIFYQWDSISQIVTLNINNGKVKVLVGSNLVLIGEDKVFLSSPAKIIQSNIYVPADFKIKVVEQKKIKPVVKFRDSYRKVREVILDPGHGGKDPGAMSKRGTREKDIVLDISRRVKQLLEQRGVKVRMTRNKDVFISLQERTEIACRSKADLFVSIHANSNPNRNTQGMEVYVLKDLESNEKYEEQRRVNSKLLFRNLAMKQGQVDLENILDDMLYANKQVDSKLIASHVCRNVCREAKIRNGGIKRAHFYVLRNTFIPSILIEVGYLTNLQEERLLKTGLHRQKLAEGIAQSILGYIHGK